MTGFLLSIDNFNLLFMIREDDSCELFTTALKITALLWFLK